MNLPDIFKSFRSTVQAVKQADAEARRKLELARRRREELLQMPPPKAEVIEMLSAYFDEQAKKWPPRLQELVQLHLFRNLDHTTGVANSDFWIASDFLTTAGIGKRPESGNMSGALAYIFRDQIRDGIGRAIMELPDWKAAPPYPQRIAEIERLDLEISKLEAELRDLATIAADAGISFQSTSDSPRSA